MSHTQQNTAYLSRHTTPSSKRRRLSPSFVAAGVVCLFAICLTSCKQKPKAETTPWGTTITYDAADADSIAPEPDRRYTLRDIQQTGEMIMLTLSGPDTYYEYHGRGMGVHYLLCEKLAETLGVTLRVDVCRDTLDMLQRLKDGEGDIIAFPVNNNKQAGFLPCGVGTVAEQEDGKRKGKTQGTWLVAKDNAELARAVNAWYKPGMLAETEKQQNYLLTTGSVTRHVYPFMLSAKEGTISQYDHLFKKHAPTAGVDWSLLAAQCYQESCFDSRAHSWAGACGLMQILPSTADHLALPRKDIYEPEPNIAAATRYMRELQALFSDVGNPQERLMFALAAYNGGYHHVRDAMALTKKYGGIWQRWSDVRHYILALSQPQYYRDPVVKNGYMRGSETANYVDMIMSRWKQYRHALRTGGKIVSSVKAPVPTAAPVSHSSGLPHHRATKKNKWRKETTD